MITFSSIVTFEDFISENPLLISAKHAFDNDFYGKKRTQEEENLISYYMKAESDFIRFSRNQEYRNLVEKAHSLILAKPVLGSLYFNCLISVIKQIDLFHTRYPHLIIES